MRVARVRSDLPSATDAIDGLLARRRPSASPADDSRPAHAPVDNGPARWWTAGLTGGTADPRARARHRRPYSSSPARGRAPESEVDSRRRKREALPKLPPKSGSTYAHVAGLPLVIEHCELRPLVRDTSGGFTKISLVVRLTGGSHVGEGEDITWDQIDQIEFLRGGVPPGGRWAGGPAGDRGGGGGRTTRGPRPAGRCPGGGATPGPGPPAPPPPRLPGARPAGPTCPGPPPPPPAPASTAGGGSK